VESEYINCGKIIEGRRVTRKTKSRAKHRPTSRFLKMEHALVDFAEFSTLPAQLSASRPTSLWLQGFPRALEAGHKPGLWLPPVELIRSA
jgi:hypothetical protein